MDFLHPTSATIELKLFPLSGSTPLQPNSHKLNFLFNRDLSIVKDPLNGVKLIDELIGIKASMKFGKVNLDIVLSFVFHPTHIRSTLSWGLKDITKRMMNPTFGIIGTIITLGRRYETLHCLN
ncbi:hypothetical protein CsSME_00033388 [Camellia sinensis var. sinensis]